MSCDLLSKICRKQASSTVDVTVGGCDLLSKICRKQAMQVLWNINCRCDLLSKICRKQAAIVMLLVFMLLSPSVMAQKWRGGLRHVKGVNAVGIAYGLSKHTNAFVFNYTTYLSSSWVINASAMYETGTLELTKCNAFYATGGIDWTPFKVKDWMYANVGIAAYIGDEVLKSTEDEDMVQTFVAGPAVNANLEFYLGKRFILNPKAEMYYSPISNFGEFYTIYSISLKFVIY